MILSAVAGLTAVLSPTLSAEPPTATPAAGPAVQTEPAKGDRAARAKERLEKMKSELGLTDEQAKKVQEIFAAQREAAKGVREDSSLSDEQRKEKLKAARAEADAQMSAVLTPEQKAKWEELKKQRPGRDGGR